MIIILLYGRCGINNIIFREFEKGEDLSKIQELFKSCYGQKPLAKGGKFPSLDELKWRYCSYLESKIFVAEDIRKGILVGIRPIIFKKIKVRDEILNAAHFMDVMVHPEYRRRGIFTNLMKIAENYIKENNIFLCYAFPNPNSYQSYHKATDWKVAGFFEVFITTKILIKIFCPRIYIKDIKIEEISRFTDDINLFFKHNYQENYVYILRDPKYLNWRYLERPDIKYKILAIREKEKLSGYIVTTLKNKYNLSFYLIAEMFISSHSAIFYHLINLLKKEKANVIFFFNYENETYKNLLKRSGFLKLPSLFEIRKFPVLIKILDKDLEKYILGEKRLLISLGDNDAI
ncbi:MAG: GNAT family N-acetyltransferase [candidate division WOR-3 bacterium]|nr:GNAT family N-acetyltransferase [Candidatus Omnitrophota bacterium]